MSVNRIAGYFEKMEQAERSSANTTGLWLRQKELFKERLQEAIVRTGISQEQIAPRIGCRPEGISRWKREGRAKPKLPNLSLQTLANLAGVEYDSLWEEELRVAISQTTASVSPGIPTVDDKFEALKRSSKWPMLAQLIDTIYAAEKATSSSP